ncbi:MAG: class I SAM-dependent methyltransferase [Planctomycetota bacterium]
MPNTVYTPTQATEPRPERISGEPLLDATGAPAEPGDVLPLPPNESAPGMLIDRELNYLHWIASQSEGRGRAVELGCFLGSSTAALVAGRRRAGLTDSMLVYDAFVAPDDARVTNAWWMRPFDLQPGQNFRKRYEEIHAGRLEDIDIREGWLPENAEHDAEREVYPEQDPIELLFVDVAKTWGVSRTVHRAFARHVRVGGVLIHQDFCEPKCPWLPVHMWLLRDVFEPMDIIRGGCTVSFRCVASPEQAVDRIQTWSADATEHRAIWNRVHDYWSESLGEDRAGFILGARAVAGASAGDSEDALQSARAFEGWRRSLSARGANPAPMWRDALFAIKAAFRKHGLKAEAQEVTTLIAEQTAFDGLHRLASDMTPGLRLRDSEELRTVWGNVADRLRAQGAQRIAFFGAGRHAHAVISAHWPENGPEIACVLDDDPRVDRIASVPVRSTRDEETARMVSEFDAVVPCSDAFEPSIVRRAHDLYGDLGVQITRVYTDEEPGADATEPEASAPSCGTPSHLRRPRIEDLDPHAPGRAALGLDADRPWLRALAESFAAPEWAQGYINQHDTLLLWDLVEAVRPDVVVEIGAAAGVSTASLAEAVRHFRPDADGVLVHTFDLAERCYFDTDRPVGGAIEEVAPDLIDRVRVHTRCTAASAAALFAPHSVPLALIDGDHRHPGPTLDLLALLYALQPGAWVALHDVELSAVERASGHAPVGPVTGAERLFQRWPFTKIQPRYDDPLMKNIGAIRLPDRPADAIGVLLELLREDWESEGPPRELGDALSPSRVA